MMRAEGKTAIEHSDHSAADPPLDPNEPPKHIRLQLAEHHHHHEPPNDSTTWLSFNRTHQFRKGRKNNTHDSAK
jgi:hypothetical protein